MVHLQQQLTDGAGFPPFAVQTRVKFWAWYRLNGAGVFSATTDMLFGGAAEDKGKKKGFVKQYPNTFDRHKMKPQISFNCLENIRFYLLSASQELFCERQL